MAADTSSRDHLFVVPADDGTPRQLTSGDYQHRGPVWMPDGNSILFSTNRGPDWEYERLESEIYSVSLDDGSIVQLTDRRGPDSGPAVSPDGETIAYVRFDDRVQTYQTTDLHFMRADGSSPRAQLTDLDRSVSTLTWASDGSGVYFAYDDEGVSTIGFVSTDGRRRTVADSMGGTAVGRPYGGGNYSVASDGNVAFGYTTSSVPSDVAVIDPNGTRRVVTALNDDFKAQRSLAYEGTPWDNPDGYWSTHRFRWWGISRRQPW